MAVAAQCGNDLFLLMRGYVIVKRQSKQPSAEVLGHRAVCRASPEAFARRRKMERNVMEYRQDSIGFQMRDNAIAITA
jgi:hypothetical protein